MIKKYTEVVREYIASGKNVNELNSWKQSPAHRAVDRVDLAVLQKLIEAGFNMDATNKDGITVKELAAVKNNEDVNRVFRLNNIDLGETRERIRQSAQNS